MSDHEIFAIVVLLLVAAEMLWFDFLAKPGPRDYGNACFHRLPPDALKRIWEGAPFTHLRGYPIHKWQHSCRILKYRRDLKTLDPVPLNSWEEGN